MPNSIDPSSVPFPAVMFGTTCLGNLFQEIPYAKKRELIRAWFRESEHPVGIDAAGKYGAGMALEILGKELASMGIRNDQIVLNNKLGWRRVPLKGPKQSFEPDAWFGLKNDAVQEMDYDGIMRCWDQGCELLNGYLPQLASIHDPDDYMDAATSRRDREERYGELQRGIQAIFDLKQRGFVKAVGIGAKQWKCIQLLCSEYDFDWVMLANSFTVMNHPVELLEFLDLLEKRNTLVINSALFQGGFLTGGELYDYCKLDPSNASDYRKLEWRERFWKLCQEFDLEPFNAAVAFGRSHSAIRSVALSTSNPQRVHSIVESIKISVPAVFWHAAKDAKLITYLPR